MVFMIMMTMRNGQRMPARGTRGLIMGFRSKGGAMKMMNKISSRNPGSNPRMMKMMMMV